MSNILGLVGAVVIAVGSFVACNTFLAKPFHVVKEFPVRIVDGVRVFAPEELAQFNGEFRLDNVGLADTAKILARLI